MERYWLFEGAFRQVGFAAWGALERA